jgi:hypothetical protein
MRVECSTKDDYVRTASLNERTISLPCTDTVGWSLDYLTYETSSCLSHCQLATVIRTLKYYFVRYLSGGIVIGLKFVNRRGFGLGL